MIDANRPDLVVGVVGTGAMGRGIAQIAAAAGLPVHLHDARHEAVEEARSFIGKMLDRAAEKGRIAADEAAAAVGRLHPIERV